MAVGLATFVNQNAIGPGIIDTSTYRNVQRVDIDFIKGSLLVDQRFPRRRTTIQFDDASGLLVQENINLLTLGIAGSNVAGPWELDRVNLNIGPGINTGTQPREFNITKLNFDYGRSSVEIEQGTGPIRSYYQLDDLGTISLLGSSNLLTLEN